MLLPQVLGCPKEYPPWWHWAHYGLPRSLRTLSSQWRPSRLVWNQDCSSVILWTVHQTRSGQAREGPQCSSGLPLCETTDAACPRTFLPCPQRGFPPHSIPQPPLVAASWEGSECPRDGTFHAAPHAALPARGAQVFTPPLRRGAGEESQHKSRLPRKSEANPSGQKIWPVLLQMAFW